MGQNSFDSFLLRELYEAYHRAWLGGKRGTEDEHRFELNEMENLVRLRDAIATRRYTPSRGVAFITHNPVTREIFAAPFVDRVVHHLLFKYADMWWGHRLMFCTYSCRKGMGTLYGIRDLQRKIRRVSRDGTVPTVAVCNDFRGYFMSIPHQKSYDRIVWGLDQQFDPKDELYYTLKFLWRKIIFDDPTNGVLLRSRPSEWDELPADKSLFAQPKTRGQVIGNLTSQELSNIYLDQLDRFIVIDLGIKNLCHYVDDFIILVTLDDLPRFLDEDMPRIEKFSKQKLELTLHRDKFKIVPVEKGVEFLGAKVFRDHILPGDRIAKNYADTLYGLETRGIGEEESVTSYDGHLAHFNSHKLSKKLWDGVGWDYPYPKLKKSAKRFHGPKVGF